MDKERSLICRGVETEADVEEAYRIYLSNPEYFLLASGHIPERREIYRDREVRPPETEQRVAGEKLHQILVMEKPLNENTG